jgi:hypothetical protein
MLTVDGWARVGELGLGVNTAVMEQRAPHAITNSKHIYIVQRRNDTVINSKCRSIIRDSVEG